MQQDANQRREMTQKIILFPDSGPRKIEKDRSHNAANHHQQSAQEAIHAREAAPGLNKVETSASWLLKRGDAFAHIAIVDVIRVNPGKTLQRRFRFARR